MRLRSFTSFVSESISESLQYHIDGGHSLMESVFRIESDAWLDIINEARVLWLEEKIDLDLDDVYLIGTDAGQRGSYRGEEVLLDVPFELD